MEKEELNKMVKENLSISGLGKHFKMSKSTVRYWLKKYGFKTNGYKITNTWDEGLLKEAIKKSECKSDILRNLNISLKSGNFQTLDRYCFKYNIDISNLKLKKNRGGCNGLNFVKTVKNSDVFITNSVTSQSELKRRVIKDNLIEYKCFDCGLTSEWNGKTLFLHLDHINGINNDNRLENLRFLCPNCHSQTETYCRGNKKIKNHCVDCGCEIGKKSKRCVKCENKKKAHRKFEVSKEQLEELIKNLSYIKIGKIFNVCDNSIKARAIKLGIKLIPRKANGSIAQ